MSDNDDRLAPVTPLFGSGWAKPGTRAPDEPEWADPDESASSEARATRGDVEAADGGIADIDGHSSHRPVSQRGREAAEPDGAVVSALPTYAAFAARSEGSEAGPDVEREPEPEPETEPEPEETYDAAKARAENISLHALSRRGVSSAEMTKTLRSRDLPDEVVAEEIERLERVGLLNDDELAENLVRSKQDRKGLGKGAITAELRQRGVAQESIEAAIAEIDDDEEQARADDWAIKRAGQLRGLDQATAERRLNGYLMRRGYRSEVIRRAVEKALPRGGPRGGESRGGVRFE